MIVNPLLMRPWLQALLASSTSKKSKKKKKKVGFFAPLRNVEVWACTVWGGWWWKKNVELMQSEDHCSWLNDSSCWSWWKTSFPDCSDIVHIWYSLIYSPVLQHSSIFLLRSCSFSCRLLCSFRITFFAAVRFSLISLPVFFLLSLRQPPLKLMEKKKAVNLRADATVSFWGGGSISHTNSARKRQL